MKFLCFTAAAKKSRFFPWGAYPAGLKRSGNCPFLKKILRGLPSAFGYSEKDTESEEELKVKKRKISIKIYKICGFQKRKFKNFKEQNSLQKVDIKNRLNFWNINL